MAPRGSTSWRRPYTSIYNDNYRYGGSLYQGTLSDIEKKYTSSLSRTQLRSDRPDVNLKTFSTSSLAASPNPGNVESKRETASLPLSPIPETPSTFKGSVFESMLNTAFHSSYVSDSPVEEKKVELKSEKAVSVTPNPPKSSNPPRPVSLCLYDDPGYFTESKSTEPVSLEQRLIKYETKRRRKPLAKDAAAASSAAVSVSAESSPTTPTNPAPPPPKNGPNAAVYWKDQCRDLQSQVDVLTQALADINNKLKGELSTMKGKLHSEMTDLNVSLEQTSHQSSDLQKTVKRQANQLLEVQCAYDDLQRHLQDALEEVSGWQRRSQTLRKEMDRLRTEVEETLQRGQAVKA